MNRSKEFIESVEESSSDNVFMLYYGKFPRFAFHAEDEKDALSKAKSWCLYHSLYMGDASVRPATEDEKKNKVHDEYIR